MTPTSAIILAAGFGTRMQPLTDAIPKALVEVRGRTLLDHAIMRLAQAKVTTIVVNVHYLADLVEAHLDRVSRPMLADTGSAARILVSDERDAILETGGGVKKALPLLGDAPFLVTNVDSLWLEGVRPNLALLAHDGLEGARARLLLASATASLGYDGRGDFAMDQDARLKRRKEHEMAPFTYAGTLLTTPSAFADMPDGAWSLNRLFDAALEEKALLGTRMDGLWMHVGTPHAVDEAEAAIEESVG